MPADTINVHRWCADRSTAFRDMEHRALAVFPTTEHRDDAPAEWVVRCLGNPEVAGAADVVALLAERHGR